MTKDEFSKNLQERVVPLLEELGIEGFVLAGYATDGDGHMGRFAVGQTNRNAAIEDGLRQMCHIATMWSAPAQEFGPPSAKEPDKAGAG